MNDITKRLESQLNIETQASQDLADGGEGTSSTSTHAQDKVSIFESGTVHYMSTNEEIHSEEGW